ncbi:MAG: hypothetical protein AAGA05_13130 [Pseudomonadota bacterium]
MRWLCLLLALLPGLAAAQSSIVSPGELELSVSVETSGHTPVVREMVVVKITGIYRRHITRENLVQPALDGFSWSQLGPDNWKEERRDGKRVKVFERHMAVYPDRAGQLEIGAFTHNLTLTDEGDYWFEHQVQSEPITIEVAPAPSTDGWWFPVQSLQVSDQWSNAPDQLKEGEAVLRVVRLEALGATPEMIPPMPELTSPSAMIFPHPEKRLVELTPYGPVTYAFWRWTIRPTNAVSTIVEPLEFEYFNTQTREAQVVTITAQRVAYGDRIPDATHPVAAASVTSARLPGRGAAILAVALFAVALGFGLRGRVGFDLLQLARLSPIDPLHWRLRRAAQRGDLAATRRAATALMLRDGASLARRTLLNELDASVFAAPPVPKDLTIFARAFLRAQTLGKGAEPLQST